MPKRKVNDHLGTKKSRTVQPENDAEVYDLLYMFGLPPVLETLFRYIAPCEVLMIMMTCKKTRWLEHASYWETETLQIPSKVTGLIDPKTWKPIHRCFLARQIDAFLRLGDVLLESAEVVAPIRKIARSVYDDTRVVGKSLSGVHTTYGIDVVDVLVGEPTCGWEQYYIIQENGKTAAVVHNLPQINESFATTVELLQRNERRFTDFIVVYDHEKRGFFVASERPRNQAHICVIPVPPRTEIADAEALVSGVLKLIPDDRIKQPRCVAIQIGSENDLHILAAKTKAEGVLFDTTCELHKKTGVTPLIAGMQELRAGLLGGKTQLESAISSLEVLRNIEPTNEYVLDLLAEAKRMFESKQKVSDLLEVLEDVF